MMIRRKGRLVLLLFIVIVCLLFAISFTGGVVVRIPVFKGLRVEKMCLYGGDSVGDNLVTVKVIRVEGGKTLEERIDLIVGELQKRFSDIELEVVGYDNISGKKVLVLDLKDKDVSVGSYLNAGSVGSRINLGILVNSLLQNGRKVSNWVDGVKILVNGEEGLETSHVNLGGVFYRTRDNLYLQ